MCRGKYPDRDHLSILFGNFGSFHFGKSITLGNMGWGMAEAEWKVAATQDACGIITVHQRSLITCLLSI